MSAFYEQSDTLSEYLLLHYGSKQDVLKWDFGPSESIGFPSRIVHAFSSHYPSTHCHKQRIRALDIGCAVGRSSFELATYADEVIGIDYSESFIEAALHLKSCATLSYSYRIHGHHRQPSIADVPESLDRSKVTFLQQDAMQLQATDHGLFDIILASNLICRLPEPKAFLENLQHLMHPGGIFILSSPFSWSETYTPKRHWLGGDEIQPSPFDAISEVLETGLELLETQDIPMLIREHERKFQWTVCHGSAWRRR